MHRPTNAILLLIILAVLGSGCNAPAGEAVEEPTSPPASTLAPTSTPLPTATSTATPIPPASSLADQAGALCEAAASAPRLNEPLSGPVMGMLKTDYDPQPSWHYSSAVPYFSAVSASEVRSILCIVESRSQTGSYNDGQPAYRRNWAVQVIQFPGGGVLASRNLNGEEPPGLKTGDGPGYDAPPTKGLFDWLLEDLHDTSVFFIGEGISTLAFLGDGNLVAAGTERRLNVSYSGVNFDARIYILDISTGEIVRTLSGHTDPITRMAASPDGRFLASGSVKTHEYNSTVLIWDVAAGRQINAVKIQNSDVRGLAFSADGSMLAVLGWETVTVVDPVSGDTLNTITPGGGAVFFDSNDLLILDTYEQILFIDPLSGATVRTLPVTCLADYSDANGTMLTCGEEYTFSLLDAEDGSKLFSLPNDGSWLVHDMASNGLLALPAENKIAVWDNATQAELITLEGGDRPATALAFSSDGRFLASGTNDGFVKIWSIPAP